MAVANQHLYGLGGAGELWALWVVFAHWLKQRGLKHGSLCGNVYGRHCHLPVLTVMVKQKDLQR